MVTVLVVIFFFGSLVVAGLCYGAAFRLAGSKLIACLAALVVSPVVNAILWLFLGVMRAAVVPPGSGLTDEQRSQLLTQHMEWGAALGVFSAAFVVLKALIAPDQGRGRGTP